MRTGTMTMAWMRARLTARTLSCRASPASRQEWLCVSSSLFTCWRRARDERSRTRTTPPRPVGIGAQAVTVVTERPRASRRSEELRLLLLRGLRWSLGARIPRPHGLVVATGLTAEGAEPRRPRRDARAPDEAADPLLLYARQVRTPCIELLVALYEIGPIGAQPVHEDTAHLPAQVQPDAADPGRPRVRRGLQDLLHLARVVVDPRHERRDQDAGRDPGPIELADGLQPCPRVGRVRLARPPRLLVDGGHRHVRADLRNGGDLLHQVEVAQQQRRLRQHRARVRRVAQRLPDPAHELVAPLDPLVRVGVGPHRDVLALPGRLRQLDPQHLGRIDLDDDLLLEVAARVEVQVGVGWAGEAVLAGMAA